MTHRLVVSVFVLSVGGGAQAQYLAEILPTPSGGGRAHAAGGGQIVGAAFGLGGGPVLWDGPGHSFVDLTPTGYSGTEVRGVAEGKQVGFGFADGLTRALLWSGSAGSVVSLDSASFVGTVAYATDGATQVGAGGTTHKAAISHALIWSGTAGSVVDLHPGQGYEWSEAYGTEDGKQVGTAQNTQVMWSGSAASMVVLPKPKQYGGGAATAISGDQIVGHATTVGSLRAVLWSVTTLAFTDLGPGIAFDTSGSVQVGYSGGIGEERAKAWFGAPGTELDLHQFLPAGFTASRALGIDENGTIVGWGETAAGSVPIVWTPVPEPATCLTLGAGFLVLLLRRTRK